MAQSIAMQRVIGLQRCHLRGWGMKETRILVAKKNYVTFTISYTNLQVIYFLALRFAFNACHICGGRGFISRLVYYRLKFLGLCAKIPLGAYHGNRGRLIEILSLHH